MSGESSEAPKDLIGFLDFYLVKKAPIQLPYAAKEAIVRFGPWIAAVLLVLALPPILSLLGLGALLVQFGGASYVAGLTYFTLLVIVEIALEIAALPGLLARKMSGWRFVFYARIVAFVSSLLAGLIVSAVIGGLLSMYILFQVRPLYRDGSEAAAGTARV
jgi:hypothetical protein